VFIRIWRSAIRITENMNAITKLQYTSAKHDKNEKKNISHRQNSSVIHPETRRNKG
jgi:hypothetical protein